MTKSFLETVFREIPQATLDADTAVCFVLDDELQLIYCNPAWDRFAAANGAPHMCHGALLGTPVLRCISGEQLAYYQALYDDVLVRRKPRELDFHCSSPEVERLMRMSVYPMRHTPALLVACSLRIERPHPASAAEPVPGRYLDKNGLIVMCGHCRRTRRTGAESDTWDWVPHHVANAPPRVSHGLCPLCVGYYYPRLK